jgi:uncharacterized protein
MRTPDGEVGLNYLCDGYKAFFRHADPAMRTMARLVRSGRDAEGVMQILSGQGVDLRPEFAVAGRNEPCPCGSGRKFKRCHGRNSFSSA